MAGVLRLGLYVLLRFSVLGGPADRREGSRPLPRLFLAPLGAFAGFMDAAGGGGWGPISHARAAPRGAGWSRAR